MKPVRLFVAVTLGAGVEEAVRAALAEAAGKT